MIRSERAIARMREQIEIVRAFLAASGEKPQLTNWVAQDTKLERSRALACLRELELDGAAVRLPEGWVLVANKGARLSEAERYMRLQHAMSRGTAEGLITWVNHNWPIRKKKDLLDAIDLFFPKPEGAS